MSMGRWRRRIRPAERAAAGTGHGTPDQVHDETADTVDPAADGPSNGGFREHDHGPGQHGHGGAHGGDGSGSHQGSHGGTAGRSHSDGYGGYDPGSHTGSHGGWQ